MNDLSKAAGSLKARWLVVGEESEAQRIDNFLLRELRGVPKSHVYRVLRSGEVRVNSARVKPDYRLQVGDRVRIPPVRISEKRASARPLELPVAFEDASLLVIDKPSGVAVHGGSGLSFGVIESLRAARPQAKFLELAHRLDRDTSGLLILCKKRTALVELHRMLRDGEVHKIYFAVVKGVLAKKTLELRESLHKYVTATGERRVAVQPDGVSAVTRVRKLRAASRFSFLEVELLTGRTHQIRVHLAHAGHPIVGDDKYGDFALNRELRQRLLLHAGKLAFRHPVSGEPVKLESAPPADMQAFLDNTFP
jgi:23S rRNA pseudouridine955/2504/2580 synthase